MLKLTGCFILALIVTLNLSRDQCRALAGTNTQTVQIGDDYDR